MSKIAIVLLIFSAGLAYLMQFTTVVPERLEWPLIVVMLLLLFGGALLVGAASQSPGADA